MRRLEVTTGDTAYGMVLGCFGGFLIVANKFASIFRITSHISGVLVLST